LHDPRPDLLDVALPAVAVLDMLQFNQLTMGWAFVAEQLGMPGLASTLSDHLPWRV